MSVRKHTAYNLLGALLPMGVSLLTIPSYIRLVGDARYGVLALVWAFLGYFGMFDLGLGRATAQRIAALGGSSPQLIASTFWTALAMNGALGVVGGLVIWPVSNYFFGHELNIDADLRSELWSALPWLIFAVPLMTLSGVVSGALQGRAQFAETEYYFCGKCGIAADFASAGRVGAWSRLGVASALGNYGKVAFVYCSVLAL